MPRKTKKPAKKPKTAPEKKIPPLPNVMDVGFFKHQRLIVLRNRGMLDPEKIDDYIARDGYKAVEKALTQMKPEEIIETVKKSGLRGRGGAGFKTGLKWELCRKSAGNMKYIICNGDEGDPGAFMDRSVLEADPHAVIEGMVIGAFAIGASKGYIYVRKEYPLAVKNVKIALKQAEKYGLIGEDILGTGLNFSVEVVQGAGAFVCGEETALMAAIEGRTGRPRPRPPYPTECGLWSKPTNINNVETWANVPPLILKGADWFSSLGTEKSKGTKIFSLVGKINNTGLVEVPMGIPLRKIIYDIGGGIPRDKEFKAVQTGGPSGGCIPRQHLDLHIDYESLTEMGSMMGSGGMIVMDEDTCMVDVARYFLNFTQQESCGKCPSCRLGTKQMVQILNRITEGEGREGDIELLEEIGRNIQQTALCGLGQTAPNPVLSSIRYFRNEYEAHIKYKQCPAVFCREITYPPCMYACPIDTEASVYIAHIAHGEYGEAFDIIKKDNPLPGVVGRVCHHPCEAKCRAGAIDKPIGIRALKRFVTDWAKKKKYSYRVQQERPSGKRVAIIGSGPAGLTAAYNLALKGHGVTIFEAENKIGGMLRLGIPEYRLPRSVLERDLKAIMLPGIEVKNNTRVGKDITVDEILNQGYGAIFVAIGAYQSLKIGIPGEDCTGILYSMDFLKSVHTGKEVTIGKRVAVVGGGNSAVDAARVARRMGSDVTIIYRRTQKEMPAFEEEVENAMLEGVEIIFLSAPVKAISTKGKLTAVECIRMELGAPDASGRPRPVPIKGSEYKISVDTLIAAISEQPQSEFLRNKLNLTKWQTVELNENNFMTSQSGIFAGGDAIRGPSTVIEAIRDGKKAAVAIDAYLNNSVWSRKYEIKRPSVWVEPVTSTEDEMESFKKIEQPVAEPSKRKGNFNEVERSYTEIMARKEAKRCLRCEFETADGKNYLASLKSKKHD